MWFLVACITGTGSPGGNIAAPSEDSRGEPVDTFDTFDTFDTSDAEPQYLAIVTPSPRQQVDPVVCEDSTLAGSAEPTYRWFVDGAPFSGLTLHTHAEGDTVFPGYTRAGQVWTCLVSWGEVTHAGITSIASFDPTTLDPLLHRPMWVEAGVIHYEGPLVLQPAVSVLYGFDGWSAREAPEGATGAKYPEGERRWGVHTPMVREGEGWAWPVSLPAGVRAVSAIFDSGGISDDRSREEYTWDVVFPSIGPFLTWNDVAIPTEGIVVNWETGQPGRGIVEYGPDDVNVAYQAGETSDTLHHVSLTGLPAGTPFVYRVHDANGRASPWARFTTAEAGADSFTFLVASDMQDDGGEDQRWPELAAALVNDWPDARFLLAPGDLAAEDEPGFWWLFFDGGRELFDHVPLVPALGNHDTPTVLSSPDSASYRRLFDLPTQDGDEDQYRLDYGRMRLFALNTEVMDELGEGGRQYEWLRSEVASLAGGLDRPADWAITFGHHPGYDIGRRFAVETPVYRPLTALFDGAIDVDIRAHEHIYQRFHPMRYPVAAAAEYGLDADQGVAYVVTPACGFAHLDTAVIDPTMAGGDQLAQLAWPPTSEETRSVEGIHGFLVGKATPEQLTLAFYGYGSAEVPTDATVEDELVITR